MTRFWNTVDKPN